MEHLREMVAAWIRSGDDWLVWAVLGLKAVTSLLGLFVAGKWACKKCGAALAAREEHPAVAKVLAALAGNEAAFAGTCGLDAPGVQVRSVGNDWKELEAVKVAGLDVLPLMDGSERQRVLKAARAANARIDREQSARAADWDRKAKAAAEAKRLEQRAALAEQLANPGPAPAACGPARSVPILAHAPSHAPSPARIPAPPVAACLCGQGCGCDPCPCPSERKAK